ncbi:DUF1565 domain-containing protein [Aetokthonos hydrillicola Thurmond2011]|jgi:parallel beta-helix repeat protein|uniref:DUF1565 domain-containing protein n=1 Tax=Aetokthonos hydrillicola Thurmond2011 TaxID=2712845 RepID=A0AAP5I6H4_9CYAN|nr:S-layer homology domain-containing protein [Aetokthonos hydrillicola]MBO3461818.1 DUF1565 domain-containing protein [Aetokthonos hydrillicola CCALA 1050]MBW4589963.1 S-layer homology domain-containing protein [Aetokthonos hydrillicola CCALA 1050]MDR9895711.1 DUF1565 domain-containing protein [Aetokthonos hydrillicola Thurmond2011]
MVNSTLVATLYVNPVVGNDANTGSRSEPYKTLSRALRGTTTPKFIQLAPGTYSTASGDVFPVVIPPNVTVIGNEATKGQGILILGSGKYHSLTFGVQKITLLLLDDAQLKGVSVTNPTAKGTGVWIESTTSPTLANNTFTSCGREGVFACGAGKPVIMDNVFVQNVAGGLVVAHYSKGEVLRNIFQNNALAIIISDFAAPLIANNKLSQNRTAIAKRCCVRVASRREAQIALSRKARPILRHNLIEKNTQGGLLINGHAAPDFGTAQDPAGNIFRHNAQFDVQNLTSGKVICSGNNLNLVQVKGLVDLVTLPDDISSFSDMVGHWAKPFVGALLSSALMNGFPNGIFAPEAPVTRAQYAALVAKIFQLPICKRIQNFTDIKPNFWATSAINRAVGMGFLDGFPDGTFRPTQNLTRVEVFLSMVNGLKLSGGNPNALNRYCDSEALWLFADRTQIPSYATNAVAAATQKMLIVNYPRKELLEPLRNITRAEVAALIYQALVASGKQKAIVSPYIVNPNVDGFSCADLISHWAEPFIRALMRMNLTRGFADGSYQPDKPMTRAEYAALIVGAFGPVSKRPAPTFIDIPRDYWASSAIQIAAQSGFVGGFSVPPKAAAPRYRTFRPEQNVLRIQVIVSLVNGLALKASDCDTLLDYSDLNAISESARAAVVTAVQRNIIVNYPDPKRIEPSNEATRAEVGAMVYQALVAMGRVSPFLMENVN